MQTQITRQETQEYPETDIKIGLKPQNFGVDLNRRILVLKKVVNLRDMLPWL
jgi:hypothetical protein